MGNSGCCCASDDSTRKDKELDMYINKHHKEAHKMTKFDKKDYFLSKQDLPVRTYKAQKFMEVLDEKARSQDMQTPESIKLDILSDLKDLSNSTSCVSADNLSSFSSKPFGERKSREMILKQKQAQYALQPIIEEVTADFQGEVGIGGKPLKNKTDNPYLEIDLIDPTDPILFEGEIQKYKPGFKGCFIDRWVQVTAKAFRYFVSKPSKDNTVIRPLLAIPIAAIKSCNYVNYDLPIMKKDVKAMELASHQFELFLKEDFLDYFLTPQYEKHFSPSGTRVNTGIKWLETKEMTKKSSSPLKRDSQSIKERYIKEEENQLEEPLSQAAMVSLNTHNGAWTNREEMWILEDRRLLFATKANISTSEWVEVFQQLVEGETYALSN